MRGGASDRAAAASALASMRLRREIASGARARRTEWRDGTTHLEMSPVDLLDRLAALVPRPRLPLLRCHGAIRYGASSTPTVEG
jgi:hypothetical protein